MCIYCEKLSQNINSMLIDTNDCVRDSSDHYNPPFASTSPVSVALSSYCFLLSIQEFSFLLRSVWFLLSKGYLIFVFCFSISSIETLFFNFKLAIFFYILLSQKQPHCVYIEAILSRNRLRIIVYGLNYHVIIGLNIL